MAFASSSDVQDRLGRTLTDDETVQVEALLNDVEVLIKTKVPDLEDLVTDGEIDQALVVMIEANSVIRLIRNPNGYTSETDGSYSYQINWRLASGSLNILDTEWSLLGISSGIFVIHPKVRTPFESAVLAVDPGSLEYAVWTMNNPMFWRP